MQATQGYCLSPPRPTVTAMSTILDIIVVVAPFAGVAWASQRWGAEQRPGLGERRPERAGERWAIR